MLTLPLAPNLALSSTRLCTVYKLESWRFPSEDVCFCIWSVSVAISGSKILRCAIIYTIYTSNALLIMTIHISHIYDFPESDTDQIQKQMYCKPTANRGPTWTNHRKLVWVDGRRSVLVPQPIKFPLKTEAHPPTNSVFFSEQQVCFTCRIFPRCRCRRLLYYGIVYSVACFIILYILDIKLDQNGNIPESEQLQDAVCIKSSAWSHRFHITKGPIWAQWKLKAMSWPGPINWSVFNWWLVRVTLVVSWWFFAPKF